MTTTKSLVLSVAVLGLTVLGGCEVYFDDRDNDVDDGYTYCDESGCWYCDDWGCYPDDGNGGWGDCASDYDCAAGCYCASDGACVEAGFCSSDSDCPEGFVCDDRASCVPEGDRGSCDSDADCPYGSYCDEASGVCVGSWTCTNDDDCGPGFECNEFGTCVPRPCTSDDECMAGCYCDLDSGTCEETTTCSSDDECLEGFECDEDRGTCVPCSDAGCTPPDPGQCYAEAGCGTEPSCPAGSFAGVGADACYTGLCIPAALCPDDPPFECVDAVNEADCSSHTGCESVFIGIDCVDPMGISCTEGSASCVCDHFEYGFCRDE